MVFKKSGNSRDDKPKRSSGRPAKTGDSPRSSSPRSGGTSASKYDSKSTGKPYGDRAGKSDKPYGEKPSRSSSDKPYGNRSESDKPYGDKSQGSSFSRPYGEKPSKRSSTPYTGRPASSGPAKSFGDRPYSGRSTGGASKPYGERPSRGGSSDKPYGDKPSRGQSSDKPYNRRPASDSPDKPYNRRPNTGEQSSSEERPERRSYNGKPRLGESSFVKRTPSAQPRDANNRGYTKSFDRPNRGPRPTGEGEPNRTLRTKKPSTATKDDGTIRLNRYISNAGICSRRKADELIAAGVVSVNGVVISELGHKVDPMKDIIRYNGETLKREKNIYVLLNKPKDYITTTDDPQERRTVMHLVEKASKERIYPVGRLDRNTTGLLLMTNDGDLADKLSHPKNNISKLYMVELNKSLTQGDLNKIGFGLELEDGFIKPDSVSYVAGGTKREIGIQIHSGRNRIVRRIFEHLGYEVEKLDRSVYANLTKKDLPRGRWRMLDEKEIIQLKHLLK